MRRAVVEAQSDNMWKRQVGGELVSSIVAESASVNVEIIRRRSKGPISWSFQQPRPALFWFRSGVESLHLVIDGEKVDNKLNPSHDLGLIPAVHQVVGEFEVSEYVDYVVAFLDVNRLDHDLPGVFSRAVVGFGHPSIRRSLAGLASEAVDQDPYFDLYAEGWALQTLAQLARMSRTSPRRGDEYFGGLSALHLRVVREFVSAHRAESLTVAELAALCDLSPRHFLRAFKQSTGLSPMRYIIETRTEEAKRRLAGSNASVTTIAWESGYTHSQHFTTRFKKETGMSPSEFRRLARGEREDRAL